MDNYFIKTSRENMWIFYLSIVMTVPAPAAIDVPTLKVSHPGQTMSTF